VALQAAPQRIAEQFVIFYQQQAHCAPLLKRIKPLLASSENCEYASFAKDLCVICPSFPMRAHPKIWPVTSIAESPDGKIANLDYGIVKGHPRRLLWAMAGADAPILFRGAASRSVINR
jgi:hypothetical protein